MLQTTVCRNYINNITLGVSYFMSLKRFFAALCLSAVSAVAAAQDYPELHASIERLDMRFKILEVTPTPMFGMYKLKLNTGDIVYMSADGDHFFAGTMYQNLVGEKLVNLTELDAQADRRELMKSEAAQQAWVYPAKGEKKASITVFTDIDCFYCQKLHAEMDDINALGIEVRYLSFPRAGIGSSSHKVLADAWCADDPNEFLTIAKKRAHDKLPPLASPASCDNPVADHYNLVQALGLNGTPAIVSEKGELWPGYLPAKQLAQRLGIN